MLRVVTTVMLVLSAASAMALAADMRSFSSRHYRIDTDLDPALSTDIARRMDAMYEEYCQRFKRFDTSEEPAVVQVHLFARRDGYVSFVGTAMRGTGGVFMPAKNALAAVLEGQGRDGLRRTLQHEAFHQFAAETIHNNLPMWLNEGIAQYFEEGLWTGDGFVLGQVPPRRVRQLHDDIKARRLIPFEPFMNTAPEGWAQALASRSPTRGATQYNQAWAMVHFLLNTNDVNGQPMRQRLLKMLDLIHAGQDPSEAFVAAFSANYKGFQERFLSWAAQLKATDEATYIENQGVLADMLVAMQGYGKTFSDMEAFRKAVDHLKLEIRYSKGQIKWASDKNTNIYFSRLNGLPFGPRELYFQSRHGAPLPDIICRCLPEGQLRTRFYKIAGGRIEHEVIIEVLQPTTAKIMASPLLRLQTQVTPERNTTTATPARH